MTDERKALDKEALRLWKQVVLQRFHSRCFLCRRPAHDAHHIVGRSNWQLRHTILNGIALCRECHSAIHTDSDKNKAMVENYSYSFPEKHRQLMIAKKYKSGKILNCDIEDRIKRLEESLDSQQQNSP